MAIYLVDDGLQEVFDEHKICLKMRCQSVTEGTDKTGGETLLNAIYTELYITEGQSEEVNTQHEVSQLETASNKKTLHDAPIKCCDIFKALPDQKRPIRVVLTYGVAGVGKTFSVQKFTLDWAEGLENQDISVVILLSFRELNLIRDGHDKISPDRSINIFHCLMEMNDLSVHQEIQEFLNSENRSEKRLYEIHCSALAYMLQMSEVLDELDLNKYNTSEAGRQRLIPAVRNCRKALLSDCGISKTHCEVLASALKSNSSHLIELDLTFNELEDSGLKLLSVGLESPHCKLEILKLWHCGLSEISCATLSSALKLSNPSRLRHLDLSYNKLQDSGVKQLCGFLEWQHSQLETLRLRECSLSKASCTFLCSALELNPYHLRELVLSRNGLQDSDMIQLVNLVNNSKYRLENLCWHELSVTVVC
ncbi:NACHT, LRR and PYD domains-containing protein 12-like [Neolamprologus brichardi]|uniref:NACHT, LRR and PYD domains-containing protein 12-like n=1 Tax=Neolamprologus brichardi TaxID=32507 RepID=UPI0016436FD5|nr:NACHT, LRR and PYD domains-containing protein 12-like [Neolamprologus brichardi]